MFIAMMFFVMGIGLMICILERAAGTHHEGRVATLAGLYVLAYFVLCLVVRACAQMLGEAQAAQVVLQAPLALMPMVLIAFHFHVNAIILKK